MALIMPEGMKGIEYTSQFNKSSGGAESNVAIGLARLGHHVGWFGHLGNDPLGRTIIKSLRGEGIDVSQAKLSNEAPTGLMIRERLLGKSYVYYYRRFSAASLMKPEDLDEEYIKSAKILHITGITAALSMSCRETLMSAIEIARKHGIIICFDPNLRLKLWSVDEARKVLLDIAQQVDYFLPGLDELKLLYQTDDFEHIVALLKELKAVSVVKGDNETYIIDKGKLSAVPWFKVEHIVDTVGAGDGFCAGFISGLLKKYSHKEAVKLGNLIGSIVVQSYGDWEALPTGEQVQAIMDHKIHIER